MDDNDSRTRGVHQNLKATALAVASAAVVAGLSACEHATLIEQSVQGPSPQLVKPAHTLIPTVNVAAAKGWPAGAAPQPAPGLAVSAFAKDLEHPRWVYVLPNGDVLVAETNAPPKPDDGKGFKGQMMKLFMKKAGAGVPSANRITLLRDSKGTGSADTRTVFLQGLNSPFGMALVGNDLYVACTDAILRFPYTAGATQITAPGEKIVDLPAGTFNQHCTMIVIASPEG
jgi:glucose/arabinose dehydrogenase